MPLAAVIEVGKGRAGRLEALVPQPAEAVRHGQVLAVF